MAAPGRGRDADSTPGLRVEVTSVLDGTRTEAWNDQGALTVARSVDLAPGPPDAAGSWLFPIEYGGQMSALAIAGSQVSSSTYEGRRVLVVSAPAPVPARSSDGSSAMPPRYDKVAMVIDRETWLPIRVVRSYRGTAVESWGLSDVELDAPLTAADFTVQLPRSAELDRGQRPGVPPALAAKGERGGPRTSLRARDAARRLHALAGRGQDSRAPAVSPCCRTSPPSPRWSTGEASAASSSRRAPSTSRSPTRPPTRSRGRRRAEDPARPRSCCARAGWRARKAASAPARWGCPTCGRGRTAFS